MSVSTSLPHRAAERGRARRRSRLVGVLTTLLVLALLLGAGWLLLGSDALGVDRVRVTGVQRLTAADVEAHARIAKGTPLARLDTDAVAERVTALAAVREVDVVRRWPGTVEIAVRERTPAAVLREGTGWLLVDRTGVAFARERRRLAGLPVLDAAADAGRAELRSALDVLDSLPAAVRADVREVSVASAEEVTLRLSKGRSVVWGSTERAERKAAVLTVLLSRKASVYDVSAPDTPTTRK